MPPIRILVVDDSVVMRKIVRLVLEGHPRFEVTGVAANGRLALARIERDRPDLVTLDVDMPELDGLETLRLVRERHPGVRVIMLSALTAKGAEAALDALALGADDYVTKPAQMASAESSFQLLREALYPRILSLCGEHVTRPDPERPSEEVRRPSEPASVRIVVIASSTGGPTALDAIVPALPERFPVPVVVVQHMPPIFTKHLATRLDSKSKLTVQEGEGGAVLEPGRAWIAPGGLHTALAVRGDEVQIELFDGPPENGLKPAADVLFRSAAKIYGPGVLAVVLTGMGKDGALGCQAIHAAGGEVLAQDEASSVVWSMPRHVAPLASAILPPAELAAEILRRVRLHR